LIAWLAVSFAAAAIGGAGSSNSADFYQQLQRPPFAPPAWVFGPVWTALYTLLAISAWLIWRERGVRGVRLALAVFISQLVLNALWTWIFFTWREGALAFVEILVLLLVIVLNVILFWRIRSLAGALLLPYVVWVTYASVLTYSIWRRNPQLLS
jgi:tryptophan-rich sensory protein